MRHRAEEWFDGVWGAAALVRVLAGGEDGGPLERRPLLGRVESAGDLAELRALSTTGTHTGDLCRCHGSVTFALHDADGGLLGRASLHGTDGVLWEGGRFGGLLEAADPVGLSLFLARYGAARRLAGLATRLAYALGLREGRPQFREAGHGPHGARLLETRGVPRVLRPALAQVSGHDCAGLDGARVAELRGLLAAAEPDEGRRAVALLGWLGALPEPMEAEYGEGVLVRALLAGLDPVAAAWCAGRPAGPRAALGLLRWAGHAEATAPDAAELVALVEPVLRGAFPA
ncbi:hypothetical protein ABZZ17_36815 [Streptomyces sp. NPDC006512]|uniref:hypothetical protein n=1 Tax=Streptomyces sp. NPDC006512 TaxID=3154307 RepID=UPI0033A7A0A0